VPGGEPIGRGGTRTIDENPTDTAVLTESGAECGAVDADPLRVLLATMTDDQKRKLVELLLGDPSKPA